MTTTTISNSYANHEFGTHQNLHNSSAFRIPVIVMENKPHMKHHSSFLSFTPSAVARPAFHAHSSKDQPHPCSKMTFPHFPSRPTTSVYN